MAIFDIFKNKKEAEKKPAKKAPAVKAVKAKPAKKAVKRQPEVIKPEAAKPEVIKSESAKSKKRQAGLGIQVLHSPHITEKATDLLEQNKYVFKVYPSANKIEIKRAIEGEYGVDVVSVRVINIPRRKRRVGKNIGWKKGYRKAIVGIKTGQKIEIISR